MSNDEFKCGCCGLLFLGEVQDLFPSSKELYAVNWIPLRGQIYCGACIVRVLAVAVEALFRDADT